DSLGAWSYVADSAHNEFVDGTTYTDTFSVFSADGTATSVTINIEGSNDAAVLSADIANLDETNDAADISTSGQLTISDVDSPATFQAQTDTAGSYGKFSIDSLGAWSYVADSAHNEFVDGQTYTDTFSVLSADGTETSVTINIEGTNDAAIISGVSTGSVQEDTNTVGGQLTTGGLLTISDADAGQSSFQAQPTVAGTYGTFTLATTGNWTYSVSNSLAVIQALNNGQSLVDSFTAAALDGSSSQLVQVTINGLTDTTPLTGTNSNNTFSFSAAASGIYTITDPGGNNDAIQITETNTELTSLNFAKVGNDLLIEFNDQQVTVLGQYAAGGANTIESITFSSGQTFHNFTLSGTYVLVTTQTPGNANTNWVLAGTSGDDSLQGGNNTNQHDLVFGNDLDDALTGRLGGDLLVGGAGNDSLNSGAGNDTLIGGTGNDTLTGSTGADTFVFGETGAPNLDTVLDYSFAEGDKLDLSALLDSNFSGGSQVSDFVQLVQAGSNITVQVDADGTANGAAFTDIALLSNIGTAGLDQVRAWFGDTDHTLVV
ncbi:MAG TPA: VCBS domain-containing protein, partial [Pseudomonas sp.]|nr:VCBS domain-containing protein [Pseudomonas sp.]